MTELVINVGLPSKACHPNARSRSHWPKARATAKSRDAARLCALAALNGRDPPRWTHATLAAHFTFHLKPRGSPREHDEDNLIGWCKGMRDGLQVKDGAGIVLNDSGLTPLPPTYEYDNSKPAGVTLTVRPICDPKHAGGGEVT